MKMYVCLFLATTVFVAFIQYAYVYSIDIKRKVK